MTIAHSAKKIIKTQRFIFRALPALLASMFILTACIGSINIPNLSISNGENFCEANPFRHSCSQAEFETARERIVADCQAGQKDSLCAEAGAYYCYLNPNVRSCARGQQNFCDENPFRYSCSSPEFESARNRVIDDCIAGRTTGSLCEDAGGYFCHLNQDDPDCTGGVSQVIAVQTLANGVSTKDNVSFCINTEFILYTTVSCTEVFATYPCLYDPFTTECANDTEFAPFLIEVQEEREDFCRYRNYYDDDEICTSVIAHICGNNPALGDPLCPDDDPTIVNSNDWLRSNSLYEPIDSTIRTIQPGNQFLQITNGVLDTTGATSVDHEQGSGIAPTPITLNLNTATFGGVKMGGDANDGVSFFLGWVTDTNPDPHFYGETLETTKNAYAGVLDTTDLGAPLTQNSGTAEWYGSFMDTTNAASTDFILEITFGEEVGRLKAFIWQFEQNYHLLDGTFDTSGVIRGIVTSGLFKDGNRDYVNHQVQNPDGILTGLIGEQGAVGVFLNHNGDEREQASGFVASPTTTRDPNVRYSDWVRRFTYLNTTTIINNTFLTKDAQGRSERETYFTVVSADNISEPHPVRLDLSTATFNNVALGGDSDDKVGFLHGFSRTTADDYSREIIGTTRYYYAWVDILTHLDATLPVWQTGQPASAEWKGQFSVLQGTSTVASNADLTLEVNFQNRKLTAFVPVGANHYLLDAGFNADDDGFFAGTVNFGAFTNTTSRTSTNTLTSGVLTGLIGVEGALGAFVSGTSNDNGRTITGGTGNNGYSGGFVACPLHADGRCMSADR